MPVVKTNVSYRSRTGPRFREPQVHTGHRLLGNPVLADGDTEYELQCPRQHRQALSLGAHSKFTATLHIPDQTGGTVHHALPRSGDKAANSLRTVSPLLLPIPQDHPHDDAPCCAAGSLL